MDLNNIDSYEYYRDTMSAISKEFTIIKNILPINGSVDSRFFIIKQSYMGFDIALDAEKVKKIFLNLCNIIDNDYYKKGHSTFVECMQEKLTVRNEALSPFEVSVLRESAYRYYIFRSNNTVDNLGKYLPHMRVESAYSWNDINILNPLPHNKIHNLSIFEVENNHKNRFAMQNASVAPAAPIVSEGELHEVQAQAKMFEEQLKASKAEAEQLKAELGKLQTERAEFEAKKQEIASGLQKELDEIKESAKKQAEQKEEEAARKAEQIETEARRNAEKIEEDAKYKVERLLEKAIAKTVKDVMKDYGGSARDEAKKITEKNVKYFYKTPIEESRGNDSIYEQMEKGASNSQHELISTIDDAINKLRAEKSEIYEKLDKWKDNIYPKKEKLFIENYIKYSGVWSKSCDSVLTSLVKDIETMKQNNKEFDADDQIAKKLGTLSSQIDAFSAEYESAITTLGYEPFKPKAGERYDSQYHRCDSLEDGDDGDMYNGVRIKSCKKPGIKKINRLSGKEEILIYAEVEIDD